MSAMDVAIRISAINEAAGALGAVQRQIEGIQNLGGRMKGIGTAMQNAGGMMSAFVTAPIVAGLGGAVYAATQFESSMADVNKVLGFERGSAEAQDMYNSILQMSRELPVSAEGLASIAAAGGQLGIPAAEIGEFVDITARMSTAFDMTADQAGDSIARLRNVFSIDNFAELELVGDAVNRLSDTSAASAPDIVNAMTRIGGTARNFGLATNEAAALSSAIISLGRPPEIAATAINAILPVLQTATGQTDKFKAGLEMVGLSASDLEQAIATDAMGGLEMYIGALGEVDSQTRALALQKMFGAGADAQVLAALANDASVLSDALSTVADSSSYAGSMTREFENRASTTAAQFQKLQNNLMEAAINIGSALLPAINDLMTGLQPLLQGFAQFAQEHPGITRIAAAIALVVAAVGPLLMMIGGVVSAVGTITTAFAAGGVLSGLVGVFTGLGGALATMGGLLATAAGAALSFVNAFLVLPALLAGVVYGVFALGSAMTGTSLSFGTFMQVVKMSLAELPANLAAIGPAIGAFVSLIGAQFTALGSVIRLAFAQALAAATAAFAGIMAAAGAAVAGTVARIVAGAAQAVGAVRAMGSQMIGAVMAIAGQMFTAGAQIVQRLAAGIRSAIGAVTSAISSVTSAVAGFLPGSPVDTGPLQVINNGYAGQQIMSMIASGISANPLTSAMTSALQPGVGVSPVGGGAGAVGGGGGAPITINYAPVINGGGAAGQGDIIGQLREHSRELVVLIEQATSRRDRTAYS